jgi:hypothetical protein
MAVKDTKNPVTPSRKNIAPLESDIYKEEKPSPLSIEGIRSGAVQSKVFKGFIVLSGLVMAGGFVISGLNTGAGNVPPGQSPAATRATIATVGDQNITGIQLEDSFARQVQQMQQFGMKTGVSDYLRSKQQALQGLTDNAANVVAAQKAGLSVSDAEVEADIDKQIADALKPQQGQSEAAFRRLVEAEHGSLQGAKDKMKEQITPEAREAIRSKLLVGKLEKQVQAENKTTEDDYKRSVTKLILWQIVVRPKGAPLSDKAAIERNNLDAQARATALLTQLKATPTLANFKKTAQRSSDDLLTKAKGGDLGWKLPSEVFYGPQISDALSKSSSNLVGPLADTSGNQYAFFIENRKTELPKDFAKNKAKLLADFETQKDTEAWQARQAEYKKAQTPQIADGALAAYQIQANDLPSAAPTTQKTLREDAIARYGDALRGTQGMEAAAINYQLAQLYRANNERQKQQDVLAAAVKEVGSDANLRLEYARALREGGKPKEALAQLKAASTALDASPSQPSPFGGGNPDDAVRQQLAVEYQVLKQPKLAAAEQAKIKPAAPSPMGGMGGMGGLPPGVSIAPPR